MNKQAYSYSVLRYVHDVTTGEFVNVGLVLYCPALHYANAACRKTSKRLTTLFPSLDSNVFRALMRNIQARFEVIHNDVNKQLPPRPYVSVMELAQSVIPQDDSALQWAPLGSGLTSDPDATLKFLFQRFVMKHDEPSAVNRRNDEQVWRNFSKELEPQVLQHFKPKTFATADDELRFDRAWKNGVWHCLAPVSFDLANSESIREKAHKWLGQVTSVEDSADLKLYFLVGEPSRPDLEPVYQSALSILKKASSSTQVFTEADAADLSTQLAAQIAEHEANA